jgi:uncharacterized protein (TIGR03086 family)
MPMDHVSQLSVALEVTGQLIAGVREEQWASSTPCPEWDVRALVSHLITGNQLFAAAVGGGPPAGPPAPAPAQPPTALQHAYRDSAVALLAAFGEPGALERTVTVPFGTVPGLVALHLRVTELLVHGWDVARATGQPAAFPGELAAAELDFTLRHLPDVPAGRSPFAPPQPVDPAAPAIDRLAARLGRDVSAPAR